MPVFQIDIRTSAEYAEHEVDAATPAEAITATRKLWEDDPAAFDWQSFDGIQNLNGITVMDDEGHYLANWTDPDAQQALAAPALLYAAELAEDALSELARLDDGTCSMSALFALRDAIREAKGGG